MSYHVGKWCMRRMGVFDTLGVCPVHVMGAVLGAVNVIAGYLPPVVDRRWKNFYNHRFHGSLATLVAMQLGGLLAISLFTFIVCYIVMGLAWCVGLLGVYNGDEELLEAEEAVRHWHRHLPCCRRLRMCTKRARDARERLRKRQAANAATAGGRSPASPRRGQSGGGLPGSRDGLRLRVSVDGQGPHNASRGPHDPVRQRGEGAPGTAPVSAPAPIVPGSSPYSARSGEGPARPDPHGPASANPRVGEGAVDGVSYSLDPHGGHSFGGPSGHVAPDADQWEHDAGDADDTGYGTYGDDGFGYAYGGAQSGMGDALVGARVPGLDDDDL